jgi:hypothetical protein
MNPKILFLDIDGVLNSKLYYKYIYKPDSNWSRFDPYSVMLLKRLIEEFSLKIVISSTWRNGIVNRLMEELRRNDLIYYLHEDWFTPVMKPAKRGEEIKLWLEKHPEVTEYIIIDDTEHILEDQLSRFVKTDIYEGMVGEHYYQARDILTAAENQYSVPANAVLELSG